MHNIPICIANVLIDLTGPLSAAELGIEARLGPFRAARSPENPLARVAVRWEESDGAVVPQGDLIYDPGAIWKMYRAGEDYYAVFTYHGAGQAAQTQAMLRANPTWDDLTLTEQRTGPRWQSLLNLGAGELILRSAILFTNGLILHASGIDDNGHGIVFVGHSGIGKSTQLRLWTSIPGVIAIDDDRIAVRVNTNPATNKTEVISTCYGTPWKDIARNHAAPLSAIIVLEQAPENAIHLLAPATAASLLAARAFLPYWDQLLMSRAMANLNAILAHVPVYRLSCRPEKAVIPLVRSVLCSSPTVS
jgi:hypothetical protein